MAAVMCLARGYRIAMRSFRRRLPRTMRLAAEKKKKKKKKKRRSRSLRFLAAGGFGERKHLGTSRAVRTPAPYFGPDLFWP